eukprot:1673145-Rhodomonas_salina.1
MVPGPVVVWRLSFLVFDFFHFFSWFVYSRVTSLVSETTVPRTGRETRAADGSRETPEKSPTEAPPDAWVNVDFSNMDFSERNGGGSKRRGGSDANWNGGGGVEKEKEEEEESRRGRGIKRVDLLWGPNVVCVVLSPLSAFAIPAMRLRDVAVLTRGMRICDPRYAPTPCPVLT